MLSGDLPTRSRWLKEYCVMALSYSIAAPAGEGIAASFSGGDRALVTVIGVVALIALAFSFVLFREVLSADQGTPNMIRIAEAVQEGAQAYLKRQFRTLSVVVVVVFLVLFALPADDAGQRVGRSIFFLVGALFSATIGYFGMWLATRANLRVAAAANTTGRERATRIAFRTGGAVGMATVGLGLLAPPSWCWSSPTMPPRCSRASGSARPRWPC